MNTELACQFCTFINERGAKICNACGRSLGLPQVNLNPSGIPCPQCTYQNPVGSVNCVMCERQIERNVTVPAVEVVDATMIMDVELVCQICTDEMIVQFKMPGCTHVFCTSCAKQHFTIKIVECGINAIRCPINGCESFNDLLDKSNFFKELRLALYNVVDAAPRKILADKISILEIMDKPGFLRCALCNHGFINRSKTKKTNCPGCIQSFCSKCGKKWITGHTSTNCKPKVIGMEDIDDYGGFQSHCNAACPKCKYRYILERGGCMHITCNQCSYEYCMFCHKKFTGKGKSCGFPNCTKGQALHGHHPRNCMYYVRDMEHTRLESLLKKNGVRYTGDQKFKTEACHVKTSVESGGVWVEAECNKPALKSHNNMCVEHYKWHLGELMKKHKIDPVSVMNNLECFCELKRNNVTVLLNNPSYCQPVEDQHTETLRALVRTHIPYEEILQ